MYCSNCGKKLYDDVNFCTACGKKVVKLNTDCDNNVTPSMSNDDNSQFVLQVAPTTNSNGYGTIKNILDPSHALKFDFSKIPTSRFNAMNLKKGCWVSTYIDLHDYSDIKKLGFDIEALDESTVVLSKVRKTDKEIYTKIREWSFVEQFQNGFIFIEPI